MTQFLWLLRALENSERRPQQSDFDHLGISPIPLLLLLRLNAWDQSPIYVSVEIS